MLPVIVIRPQPGCDASVCALRAAGIAAHGFPMFEVHAVDWQVPDQSGFDALLVGSANVFRHGGSALAAYQELPVHAVGETTATAARAAGFTVGSIGEGGLQAVLGRVPAAHRRLLRLSGTARVALAPPAGITITERVVYDSAPLDMPDALAEILAKPAVVLLHSAEAAHHLAAECDRIGTDRASLALAAIGPRVATAAGDGWAFVVVSAQPNEAALLALAGEMCQGHGRSQTGAT